MDLPYLPSTLRGRLRLFFASVILLPLAAGILYFFASARGTLRTDAFEDLDTVLRMQELFLSQWTRDHLAVVESLAADPRLVRGEGMGVELTLKLRRVLDRSPDFDDFSLADQNGLVTHDALGATGLYVADRPYFSEARRGRSFMTDVLVSRRTGRRTLIFAAPVQDTAGRFAGAVYGSLSPEVLQRLVNLSSSRPGARTFVMEADGRILSMPADETGRLAEGAKFPVEPLLREAQLAQQGHVSYAGQDGRGRLASFSWVLGGRWLLVAETLEAPYLAVAYQTLLVPSLVTALLLLLMTPVARSLIRHVEEPVARLEEHSRRIVGGDYGVQCLPEADGREPEEFKRLNRAYCLMVDTVKDALEQLTHAARTDPLTGAANRSLLMNEGPRLLDMALRGGMPFSVLMLDLDHFKLVNDRHGHAAGDAVLRALVRAVQQSVRQSDLLARVGGEEFVVLAPNAGARAVRELAERIRRAVEAVTVASETGEIRPTVSVGTASLGVELPRAASALEALLAGADEALYAAKRGGRNRVEQYAPGPDTAA